MYRRLILAFAFVPVSALAGPQMEFQAIPPPDQIIVPTESLTTTGSLALSIDNLIDNVRDLEALLEATLISEIVQSDPDIESIDSLSVNLGGISVSFIHNGSNVGVAAENIGFVIGDVRADVDGIAAVFCPSVKFDAELERFGFSGRYSKATGVISNIAADYRVDVFNTSCSGILGFISNLIGLDSLWVKPGIENRVENSIDELLDAALGDSMFSLKQLFADLTNISLAGVGRKNFELLKTFVAGASRKGMKLTMTIDRVARKLTMLGEQLRPFILIERGSRNLYVTNLVDHAAKALDVYVKPLGSNNLHFRATLSGSGGTIRGCELGVQYHVVARQDIVPGVEVISQPGFSPAPNCSPDIEPSL